MFSVFNMYCELGYLKSIKQFTVIYLHAVSLDIPMSLGKAMLVEAVAKSDYNL